MLGLSGIRQGRHQCLSRGDVIGVFGQKHLQGGQQGYTIGIGRARLGRDPLQECNLSVDISAIGINPPP